jgi:uncharacterized glyoxalase superfamily protein PhnB
MITHVETTLATQADSTVVDTIHTDLEQHNLLPDEHIADTAYVTSANLVSSQIQQVDLLDFVLLKGSAAVEMISEKALSLHKEAGHRVLLCAGVEDVDAVYKVLSAKGVAFIKPPISQPWGRRTAYFADPEGNLRELWHSLPSEQQK